MTSEMPPFQCDPTTKLEVWLFQVIGTSRWGGHGDKVYKRLPYNLVSYDGFRNQYIEPVSVGGGFHKLLDGTGDPIIPQVDGTGRVVGMQYFDKRPFEVFAINDVDVANIGQL